MSSLIPGFLAWPLTGCVVLFTLGRFRYFRDTPVDRLVNRLFAWSAAALLLFRFATVPGCPGPVYEVAIGCVLMMTTGLHAIGCARRNDIDPDTRRRRQRRSRLFAVLATIAILLAGAAARGDGRTIDMGLTWDGLVVAFAFCTPVVINTAVFARMVVHEFRIGDLTPSERVVAASMLVSMLVDWIGVALSGLQLFLGWPQLGPHLPRAELTFTVGVLVNAVAPMFPLSMALLRAIGLDREARECRRLRPLWRDLTAAVPEIVLRPATDTGTPPDPATRIFRMTVEIRDALMHLAPYLPAQPPMSENAEDYAKRIAYAATARRTGLPPTFATPQPALGSGDFHADLRQLLGLARVWRGAYTGDPS
ncbi:MAB_1171c family putative transporter [Nocardia tenerifensis]|uniref:MAB_1171c family putative transporter n=1 Tax=Nocardia tenerifensis TaxID=228006 RepID=UPI0011B5CD52|nr:MAB_1171c family putative transporter [Nocardia tenerifensis]